VSESARPPGAWSSGWNDLSRNSHLFIEDTSSVNYLVRGPLFLGEVSEKA
jgi:hypothetical protein